MQKSCFIICVLLFIIISYSCKTMLYIPTTSTEHNSLEKLQEGRSLYVANCGSCHQLYLPNKYNATQWQHILDDMQTRAKINDMQKELIYKYLLSAPTD